LNTTPALFLLHIKNALKKSNYYSERMDLGSKIAIRKGIEKYDNMNYVAGAFLFSRAVCSFVTNGI